jgi:hypothetical protein
MASAFFELGHLFYCNSCNDYFRDDSPVSSSPQNYNVISFCLHRLQIALFASLDGMWKKL